MPLRLYILNKGKISFFISCTNVDTMSIQYLNNTHMRSIKKSHEDEV